MADDTEAGRAFEELLAASPVNHEATREDVLTGPLCASYRHEESVCVVLGMHIIPAALRRELASRARSREPLSLVLSGTLFAILPVPLLGIEPLDVDRYPARLVEAAVLRLAPPAALVEHVDRHPLYAIDVMPVGVACVDPTGDLRHARTIPAGTQVALTSGNARTDGASRTAPAAARHLAAELRALGSSHPSLFYYSGHAGGDGDTESGLVLADGILTAGHVFTDHAGSPAVPFPVRALLAACSSSGAGGAGAGEWFGLSAAVLWAGARQVVATNWKVWDTPFTSRFDQALVQALRQPADAAASLRAVQLDHLHRWRAAPTGRPLSDQPLPVTWAAYACIGTFW
jgi:hypothetical protein